MTTTLKLPDLVFIEKAFLNILQKVFGQIYGELDCNTFMRNRKLFVTVPSARIHHVHGYSRIYGTDGQQ